MKLLLEVTENTNIINEAKEDSSGKKNYSISGVFLQSDAVNRNNRMYPKNTMMKEVSRYNNEIVNKNRGLGELGHPSSPTLNMERVSHLVTELKMNGSNVVGKAKILDTPYGKIVKNLMEEGVKFGVSSRALGSLKKKKNGVMEVQNDFKLHAIDIVHDPSAPEAFVQNITESTEWIYENGVIKSVEVEEYKKKLKNSGRMTNKEEFASELFSDFLSKLKIINNLYIIQDFKSKKENILK